MPRSERKYFPPPSKVVVKRDAAATVTKGGLHVPDAAQKVKFTATVLAVGSEVKGLSAGDRIVYGGMYQMLASENEDLSVLLWPDEIMYKFEDVDVTTPEERAAEEAAKAEFEAERNRPKLGD